MEKQDDRKRRKLRESLDTGEKVLLTAERLKKKDTPGDQKELDRKQIIFQ